MGQDKKNYLTDKNFPNSFDAQFEISSPKTCKYNCLAWAMNDNTKWWDYEDDYYWVAGIEKNGKLKTFIKLLECFNYKKTNTASYESGYDKIALFSKDKIECTHLAKQLKEEIWTSKLGSSYDVLHTLKGIENGIYGDVKIIMKRKTE
ncbi:MAG: hypothetical protein HY738_16760 [Bacteroidia bacterium]|nr:hypothetical protein [Bacteroidia bacterium]